tara:strand:+ start:623 stop:733 length:111 start_codon:yes stop_codon:yes gene_type:complete
MKKIVKCMLNDLSVTKKGDIKPPFFENKISLGLLEF